MCTYRQKDAGTNTNFPEVFEHEIDSANLNKLVRIMVTLSAFIYKGKIFINIYM